jgi:hypothetical protein
MIGDVAGMYFFPTSVTERWYADTYFQDYIKLVALVKQKVSFFLSYLITCTALIVGQKPLEGPPGELIAGNKRSEQDDGADLDDSAQICSCHVGNLVCIRPLS